MYPFWYVFTMSMFSSLWNSMLEWIRSLFFKSEMELSLIGLQGAGKTSLVNVIATGGYSDDMIPTVGFNMRKCVGHLVALPFLRQRINTTY